MLFLRNLKRIALSLAFLCLSAVLVSIIIGCCSFSGPSYEGKISDHFDGKRFYNQDSSDERGIGNLIKWNLSRETGGWPEWLENKPGPPPQARVSGKELKVTYINHSTVLIQTDSLNILTDPIWSEYASPIAGFGPRRSQPPGIKFEDLPHIDIVLLSHNHYDHLDMPTLEKLRDKFNSMLLVPLGNKPLFTDDDFKKVVEMDWWDEYKVNDSIKITYVPARHFSMRGICDHNTTLWGGFVLSGSSGGPIYFAGDTGFGRHFRQIYDKFGPMRFSMLPVGSYKPRWFMGKIHLSPADAVEVHKILQSKMSMGIHFGAFKQGNEGFNDPPKDLKKALIKSNISPKEFILLDNGKSKYVP